MLHSKLSKAKKFLQRNSKVNLQNYDVIDKILDSFIERFIDESDKNVAFPNEFILLNKTEIENEDIFLTTSAATEKCMEFEKYHSSMCSKRLRITKPIRHGHVYACNFMCENNHIYRWSSSPYVEGVGVSTYLINQRMYFGYMTSVMLPSQYERFAQGAEIGHLSHDKNERFINNISRMCNRGIQQKYSRS